MHVPSRLTFVTNTKHQLRSMIAFVPYIRKSILPPEGDVEQTNELINAINSLFGKKYVSTATWSRVGSGVNLSVGTKEFRLTVPSPLADFYSPRDYSFRAVTNRLCMLCLFRNQEFEFDGILCCRSCLINNGIMSCNSCGIFEHKDNMESYVEDGWNSQFFCKKCAKSMIQQCSCCPVKGIRFYSSDGKLYCRHCYNANSNVGDPLFPYNYQPNKIVFFAHKLAPSLEEHETQESNTRHDAGKSLYIGTEVEVECGSLGRHKVIHSLKLPNWIYCKHDGSMTNGFELVNMPFTWRFFKKQAAKEYKRIFKALDDMNCSSYDAGTCGIHVHLSRKAFTTLHLYKFLKLVYENPGLMLSLSQREIDAINRYASLVSMEDPKELARHGRQRDKHYTAVNLGKESTIEVRIFRGTIRPSSFYRAVQVSKAMWQFSIEAGVKDINAANFLAFCNEKRMRVEFDANGNLVDEQEEFPELKEFLKSPLFKKRTSKGLINPRMAASESFSRRSGPARPITTVPPVNNFFDQETMLADIWGTGVPGTSTQTRPENP